jgi:predicted acylesterase/phospholipase RssA
MQRFWVIAIAVFFSGCAASHQIIPQEALNRATISGMQDIRTIVGYNSDHFKDDFVKLFEQEKTAVSSSDYKKPEAYDVLLISGGATEGAYGAGILNGWSASGTRPVFKIVTGMSTGALTAPFAFLGSAYDLKLKEFYLTHSTKNVYRAMFPLLRALCGNSLVDSKPLKRLIEEYFNASLLQAIATEHAKGRRLYVGTTNLNADALVVWDMGKIASRGDDNALRLFRKILLASCSMPGAFAPVYFKVEVDNKTYSEMLMGG